MATTTNYGWTTPDDTALVKDGASAIRTLGSSVDTTVKALSPGTTNGDLDYYSTGTTKARLAIGTNGQVLTSNGTVPTWAAVSGGGMTSLATGSLSGTTVTLSSISGSYNNLVLFIQGAKNATGNTFLKMRLNGNSGASNYKYTYNNTGDTTWSGNSGTDSCFIGYMTTTSTQQMSVITIPQYANSSSYKSISWQGGGTSANSANGYGQYLGDTNAVTSITILENAGYSFNGGTYTLYGVK
jgi:hypothetical protein